MLMDWISNLLRTGQVYLTASREINMYGASGFAHDSWREPLLIPCWGVTVAAGSEQDNFVRHSLPADEIRYIPVDERVVSSLASEHMPMECRPCVVGCNICHLRPLVRAQGRRSKLNPEYVYGVDSMEETISKPGLNRLP